jgi:hypothetical protein
VRGEVVDLLAVSRPTANEDSLFLVFHSSDATAKARGAGDDFRHGLVAPGFRSFKKIKTWRWICGDMASKRMIAFVRNRLVPG